MTALGIVLVGMVVATGSAICAACAAHTGNNSIIADAMTWRITGPPQDGVWTFPEPMPAGWKRGPIISLYEDIDKYADKFIALKMEKLLNITFEQYLTAYELYNAQAEALNAGHGINTVACMARIVLLK